MIMRIFLHNSDRYTGTHNVQNEIRNEFTVENSFDFANEVVNYDHNLYMASLDVESLFTNIPLEETIKGCVNDLLSNNLYSGKLNRKGLYDLLKLATTESSFIFDYKLYKQIDGVAVASPLGPTLPG